MLFGKRETDEFSIKRKNLFMIYTPSVPISKHPSIRCKRCLYIGTEEVFVNRLSLQFSCGSNRSLSHLIFTIVIGGKTL